MNNRSGNWTVRNVTCHKSNNTEKQYDNGNRLIPPVPHQVFVFFSGSYYFLRLPGNCRWLTVTINKIIQRMY